MLFLLPKSQQQNPQNMVKLNYERHLILEHKYGHLLEYSIELSFGLSKTNTGLSGVVLEQLIQIFFDTTVKVFQTKFN